MPHARNSIREFTRSALQTIAGLENAVDVDEGRIPDDLKLPWLNVQLGNEIIAQRTLGGPRGRTNSRELELLVDIYCRAITESVVIAEGYAAQVEAKLAANPTMGRLIKNLSLRGYTVEHDREGSQPITRIRMLWIVTYFTNERDATVPA